MYIRNFRIYRRRKEYTHQAIGNLCGCSKQNVFQWETDNIVPDQYGTMLCEVLNVQPEDIYHFDRGFFQDLLQKMDETTEEAATLIGVSAETLTRWAEDGSVIRLKKSQIKKIITIIEKRGYQFPA